MRDIIYIVFTILGIVSCSVNQNNTSNTIISLERTPCRGLCPAYTLSINKSGNATYNGVNNMVVLGEKEFILTDQQLTELESKLENYSFKRYSSSYGGTVLDSPYTIVGTSTKIIKLVRNKGPRELYDLVDFIEKNYLPKE